MIRPHETLGMKTPGEVYRKSERKYRGEEEIEYPVGHVTRAVDCRGRIALQMEKVFITNALYGWNVGLKDNGENHYEVWFADMKLGRIDMKTYKFHEERKEDCAKKVLPMS